jgi:CRP-like cAMP-binding protein
MVTLTQSSRNAETLEFLKQSPYFAGLDIAALEKISRLMIERKVEKQKIIWMEQEPAKTIYFVASGLIKLFKTSVGGKEQILRLVGAGDCFGHTGIFNGGSNPVSARALFPSLLYGLTNSDLEVLLSEYPQLTLNTIKLLATETHHYISLVEDLSLRGVNSRLARVLLEHSSKGVCDTSLSLITRADMAAMTGTVREVIGRSLKTLGEKGVIRYNRHNIIIRDSEALKIVAGSA